MLYFGYMENMTGADDSYRKMQEAREREFAEENEALKEAQTEYPVAGWARLARGGAFVQIEGHVNSADGILIRISGHGLVPIGELQKPTNEEIVDFLNSPKE